jgi:hypothetical protein
MRLHGSGSAWFDVGRPATGQRLSCGHTKRWENIATLFSGCVSIRGTTTNERDAMRASMQNWPETKVNGEIEIIGRFARNLRVILHSTSSTRPCKC